VAVDIVSLRGPAAMAELSIRTARPARIGPVSWSPGDAESCSASQALAVGREVNFDDQAALPTPFEMGGNDVVFVNLGPGLALARPGLYLDVKVDTGEAEGCMRLALTAAAGETLWQASRTPWIVGLGLRFEDPLGPLEGTGARIAAEVRVLHAVGPVRAFFGFTLGGATCRGDSCPGSDVQGSSDGENAGLFFHTGGEAGLERLIALGQWSLGITLGGRLAYFHLGAPAGYAAGTNAGVGGPFASLTLFGAGGDVVPGFAPPARRGSSGPELFIERETAFGRGPTESAWVAGFGWRLEFTN
jgi:hypothetical protein